VMLAFRRKAQKSLTPSTELPHVISPSRARINLPEQRG
jgi:hypothetical protein